MEPDELFNVLERFEEIAFKYEDDLLDRFGKGTTWILTGISFGSRSFKINYILDCGQHVCDTFPISEWMEFYWNKRL